MDPEAWVGLAAIILGIIPVLIAIGNWDWVYHERRVQRLSSLIGRTGTRILYVCIGVGVIVFGVLFALRIIK